MFGSEIGSPVLSIYNENRNETIITIDNQTHIDYGLAYPVTYEFTIPAESSDLQSYRRFQATQNWAQMVEKTTEDFFNGIEVVRFDYDADVAYVSVGFSEFSDSIFIKLMDKNELFIFKYSGVTNNKILGLLVLCSFFIGVLMIFGFYTFSSKLKSHYLQVKNDFTSDNKYLAVITENGLWIKDEINGKINIINADKINENLLINVSIIQFDKNFNLLQSIESKEVDVKSKYWIIKNPIITKENVTNKLEFTNLNLFSNLSSMSIMELTKLKKDYLLLGYSTVDVAVYQHKIFSIPIYLSIMTLLSGIIMINSKYKKSKIFNIILGISLSVIIYYVNYFSGLLGMNGKIPIILSVWLPLIVLILISMIGLVRLNEK